MPNWVCAGFGVTGDEEELARFKRMMIRPDAETQDGRLSFDFNGIIPSPPEDQCPDFEAWAVRHWGTKWNAQNVRVHPGDADGIHFQFMTAWNFPTPVFEALAREFPALVFDGSAYEDSGEFELVGQFNGADDWGPGEIKWR